MKTHALSTLGSSKALATTTGDPRMDRVPSRPPEGTAGLHYQGVGRNANRSEPLAHDVERSRWLRQTPTGRRRRKLESHYPGLRWLRGCIGECHRLPVPFFDTDPTL